MQGFKGTIFFADRDNKAFTTKNYTGVLIVFVEKLGVFSAFRFNFLSFGCYSEYFYYYFFFEKVIKL